MGKVDWFFIPGDSDINWSVAGKLQIDPRSLVALINFKEDFHFGEIGKVERVSSGRRVHKLFGLEERCLLTYIVVSSGDSGWWSIPHNNAHYEFGFHPSPKFYYRFFEPDCPAAEWMLRASMGPKEFLARATTLRLNGGSHDEKNILEARKTVEKSYLEVFGEKLSKTDLNTNGNIRNDYTGAYTCGTLM